jgi:putative ABC transport system permease protein
MSVQTIDPPQVDAPMPADSGSGNGGVPARRAVVRWGWRLFRREWRQQILVLGLLTVAIASAIAVATAAYNVAPSSAESDFGTANHFFQFQGDDVDTMPATESAAREWFGTVDVISHATVKQPGLVGNLDYRDQNPRGAFGGPMLDLLTGRYPTAADEVAVTGGVAATFHLAIGSPFALDGVQRTVVGTVENPSDLTDDFALVEPGSLASVDSVTMLVDAPESRVIDFRIPGQNHRMIGARSDVPENVIAALGVFVVSTLALFLVALVASASFVVMAQRRQRQLGMISALGATERHLRLVLVAGGAVIGLVAAVAGAAIGVLGWLVAAPHLERPLGYRIDSLNVPWWLVAVGMLLGVATAVGAAWWPARAAARVPTVVALSGRPPRPAAVHRSAGIAALILAAGIACLFAAGDVTKDGSLSSINLLLVVGGTVATIIGVLLVSPLAIRAISRAASKFPIAIRLPLRDLGRYQARSGLALAAISLVLGVPVAIIATAAAAQVGADAGNLSSHQLLVHTSGIDGPFVPADDDVAALQAGVDRVVGSIDGATSTPLQVALDPTTPTGGPGREPVTLGRQRETNSWGLVSLLYIATPVLLDRYGIEFETLPASTAFLTNAEGSLALLGTGPGSPLDKTRTARREVEALTGAIILPSGYSSVPGSFITSAELDRRGWQSVSAGQWLIETPAALTSDQLSAARELAAASGLDIESRDTQVGLSRVRTGAMLAGMALALAILAMTVGLIRSEASGDLRTLAATGASSHTRRTLTASTAGGLALLGAILGTVGAYAALAAGPFGKLSRLSHVPYAQLAMILIGTPTIAVVAGWLLAGREPKTLSSRQVV